MQVSFTVEVSTTMTEDELEQFKAHIKAIDWVGLHEIDQGGEFPAAFLTGGFNPMRLLVHRDDTVVWERVV